MAAVVHQKVWVSGWNVIYLIKVYKEDEIVTKTTETMKCRHFDDECKEIINESVQSLVNHGLFICLSYIDGYRKYVREVVVQIKSCSRLKTFEGMVSNTIKQSSVGNTASLMGQGKCIEAVV